MLHDVTWSNASLIAFRTSYFPLIGSTPPPLPLPLARCVCFTLYCSPSQQPPSIKFSYHPPSVPFISCLRNPPPPPMPRCHERKGRNASEGNLSQPASWLVDLRIAREPRPESIFSSKKRTSMAFFFLNECHKAGRLSRWQMLLTP